MRRSMLRWFGGVVLLVGLTVPGEAQQSQPTFPLWSGGAPGAVGQATEDTPSMTPYLPAAERANGTAVIVFPGGGYQHLSMEKEGSLIAEWLNTLGVTAFVVQYRLGPTYHHPRMLEDAQRALRTVRARAGEWGVNPGRVGVIGFSAGGHLASSAGTHFDSGDPAAADPIARQNARPDFMMLLYPVITMQDAFTHRGSKLNLLGERPAQALVWSMSNELQVTPETPPTFLVHTTDDAGVPVENSLDFYRALRVAGVPVEMHLYETGAHGMGLAPGNPVLSTWPGLAEGWMRAHGWLTR